MIRRSIVITFAAALLFAAVANAAAQTPAAPAAQTPAATPARSLSNPASLNEKAPETFRAKFETSKGDFVVEVTRAWAPNGADRFYNLVKNGFFTDVRFFRVLSGFMAQFGINGDPAIQRNWFQARIPADPVKESNRRGTITYAMAGAPTTRTTQLFINFGNNGSLDAQGFAPFGRVVTGMDVVDKLHAGYGEGAPSGRGPNQQLIQQQGNAYLTKDFPQLDFIRRATIEQ